MGVQRRVLWEFLRDEVEPCGLVSEMEKRDFEKLMDKMTSHMLLTGDWDFGSRKNNLDPHKEQEQQMKDQLQEKKAGEIYGHLNRRIVRIRKDSLHWILHRGALLVPDSETRKLASRISWYRPVWGSAELISKLVENGHGDVWQIVDNRCVWPWHDDY